MVELIFLTGMPGSGKSYIGRRLARARHLQFTDLDQYIEERSAMPITQWFGSRGEPAFRAYEQECMEEIIRYCDRPTVVATGGGTPCFGGMAAWMAHQGRVIYLECAAETLAERLIRSNRRPLFSGYESLLALEARLTEMLDARKPYYQHAHFTVNCTGKTTEQILNEIHICLEAQ